MVTLLLSLRSLLTVTVYSGDTRQCLASSFTMYVYSYRHGAGVFNCDAIAVAPVVMLPQCYRDVALHGAMVPSSFICVSLFSVIWWRHFQLWRHRWPSWCRNDLYRYDAIILDLDVIVTGTASFLLPLSAPIRAVASLRKTSTADTDVQFGAAAGAGEPEQAEKLWERLQSTWKLRLKVRSSRECQCF